MQRMDLISSDASGPVLVIEGSEVGWVPLAQVSWLLVAWRKEKIQLLARSPGTGPTSATGYLTHSVFPLGTDLVGVVEETITNCRKPLPGANNGQKDSICDVGC